MTDDLTAPVPGLAPAFAMRIERGEPVRVGAIATGGRRSHVSVTGGSFTGEGLSGTLTGGSETLLERTDGVTMIEVVYYITFSDGAVARCFGTGYRTAPPHFGGTRLSLLFEAAETGSVAALATRAFMAEQVDGDALVSINRII